MGINIALAGNPNCGKTTLFNELTGASQYVGNWPGVTVEKKEGHYKKDKEITITDLPGVYSLSPYTPEEIVTRDYLTSGKPDVVIDIVDATNLERNLYLTTQILDLDIPVVIALNMMDLIEKNGDKIDVNELSDELGCPVIEISALRNRGVEDVMDAAIKTAQAKQLPKPSRNFGDGKILFAVDADEDELDEAICTRYDAIAELCERCLKKAPAKLTTTQKIDRVVTNRVLGIPIFIAIMFFVYYLAVSIGGGIVTDWANDGISGDGWLYTGTAEYEAAAEEYEDAQGIVEAYETGIEDAGITMAQAEADNTPVVIEAEDGSDDEAINYEAYAAASEIEEPDPASGEFGIWIPGLRPVVSGWLESIDAAPWVISLVVDGIIAGVGAVIGFIPQLIILFLLLGFLEGCGYMARVAFIMDRIFRRFGLSGKSFIPMLIASGCGVPAVMATKTIENEKDRRMTIMTTTMIPCGAKLPIIALVFGALAGGEYTQTWWVAPLFYFMGLAAIIISCIILKKFRAFAGQVAPFIMEMPQYHLPTVKSVLLSMWERVRSYIVKAGTIIFLSTIVIWFLMNFGIYEGQFGLLDSEAEGYLDYSLMAGLGSALAWIFAPLGFGNWESAVTSITGLVAKENVAATVGIITSLGDVGEADPSLWQGFGLMLGGGSAAIMAFCAFNLLCAPCFAAIGTIRRQMSSAKWTWATIGYMCVFAWCVALMIYQLGGLALGEVAFGFWTVIALCVAAGMLFLLFRPMPKFEDREPIAPANNAMAANA